jgi:uncharacterized membrane protein SpoIIM required for sporulation
MKLQHANRNAFSIGLFLAMFLFASLTAQAAVTNANQTNNPVVSNLRIPFNQTESEKNPLMFRGCLKTEKSTKFAEARTK